MVLLVVYLRWKPHNHHDEEKKATASVVAPVVSSKGMVILPLEAYFFIYVAEICVFSFYKCLLLPMHAMYVCTPRFLMFAIYARIHIHVFLLYG